MHFFYAEDLVQTTNLIINLDHDDWVLDDDSKLLVDIGFGKSQQPRETLCSRIAENETEVSFFNRELYEAFKVNPEVCSTLTFPSITEMGFRLAGSTCSTPRRDKATVDGKYSSIIMAKSLARDKDVLTVEPEIENGSDRMQGK